MEAEFEQIIKEFIEAMFIVSSRRTSLKFAGSIFSDAFDILENRYILFKKMRINIQSEILFSHGFQIQFIDDITHMQKHDIGKALESFIRLIYNDINEESGLYFITELKNHIQNDHIEQIIGLGIDLDQIQSEQHLSYTRKKRKQEAEMLGNKENALGYSWSAVSDWIYNKDSKSVDLFDDQGNILDKIDLEKALKHYVVSLSGESEISDLDLEDLLDKYEKPYSFLKLIYQENIDFDTAKNMLNLSNEGVNSIIKELVEMKFLIYVSDDEVELTKSGKEFIEKK